MSHLQDEEDKIYAKLAEAVPGTKAYGDLLTQLGVIARLMLEADPEPQEKQKTLFEKIITNPTVISSGAYLFGMLLMIRHEEFNIITSKAISHLPKIK